MKTAATHLVEYAPYPMRNERCAIGILVRLPDNKWQAHPASNLKKVRAMNPSCNTQALREGLHAVAQELQSRPETIHLYADGASGIVVSPNAGRINYVDQSQLKAGIQWALAAAVEPIQAAQSEPRASVSRLFIEIKKTFDAYGWMAPSGAQLASGRIVPRFALQPEEGLTLDFAQRSSHAAIAIQTLDYRHNARARRVEASAKLLTMDMARQCWHKMCNGMAFLPGQPHQKPSQGCALPSEHAMTFLSRKTRRTWGG